MRAQSSTFWQSGEFSLCVAERGKFPTLGGNSFGRSRFLVLGVSPLCGSAKSSSSRSGFRVPSKDLKRLAPTELARGLTLSPHASKFVCARRSECGLVSSGRVALIQSLVGGWLVRPPSVAKFPDFLISSSLLRIRIFVSQQTVPLVSFISNSPFGEGASALARVAFKNDREAPVNADAAPEVAALLATGCG